MNKGTDPVAIFKLGSRPHIEDLLREGHVYMNTASYFATLEDGSPRRDSDEGTAYAKQATGGTLRMHRGERRENVGTLVGPVRLRTDQLLSANIYCLHARSRADYGRPFQLTSLGFGDSFVLFFDAQEFFRRLRGAANDSGRTMEWHQVEYVDRNTYNGEMGLFRKFSEHAGDQEVRVAVFPGGGGPLSLRLGSLEDIAMMGATTDVLELEPNHTG